MFCKLALKKTVGTDQGSHHGLPRADLPVPLAKMTIPNNALMTALSFRNDRPAWAGLS